MFGVAIAFVCLLALLIFALLQRQEAFEQKLIAQHQRMMADKAKLIVQSQALPTFALSEMDKDLELSILLAQESIGLTYGNNPTVLSFSNTALRKVTYKSRPRLTFTGHDVPLSAVRYSPDGNRIVSVTHRTIKIWIAVTGEVLKSIFVSSFRELEPQWTENRNDSSGQ